MSNSDFHPSEFLFLKLKKLIFEYLLLILNFIKNEKFRRRTALAWYDSGYNA